MGFFGDIWNGIKKGFRGLLDGLRIFGLIIVDVIFRILNIVDIIFTLFGIKIKKYVYLDVVILSDEKGPLATIEEVMVGINTASQIFEQQMNVQLTSKNKEMISTVYAPAPEKALNISCGGGAFGEEFSEAGDFFDSHLVSKVFGITVFIVKEIDGERGCSLGPLTSFVTIEGSAVDSLPRLLAHEVSHACGNWHVGSSNNLMLASNFGNTLNRWQEALFRSSRHVLYWD